MTRQAEFLSLFLLIILHINRVVTLWYKTKISNGITIHVVRNILQQITQDQNFKTEMIASKGMYVKRLNNYYKEINITTSHES